MWIKYEPPLSVQYKDYRWQELADQIRQRDNYTCTFCNERKHCQVHHRKYTVDPVWEEPHENLITACDGCHEKFHIRINDMRFMMSFIPLKHWRIIHVILRETFDQYGYNLWQSCLKPCKKNEPRNPNLTIDIEEGV